MQIKTKVIFGTLLMAGLSQVFAQTAAEKDALKKLGNAFYVYDNGYATWKVTLDGSGQVNPVKYSEPADSGTYGCISPDGKYIAYVAARKKFTSCNIVVMNSDLTNRRVINKEPFTYAGHMTFTNNPNKLVFTAGPATVRPDKGAFGQQAFTIDFEGNVVKILDYVPIINSTASSYYFIGHIDVFNEWVTWQWNSVAYVAKFNNSSNPADYLFRESFQNKQHCGMGFNNDGTRMTLNDLSHLNLAIYKRDPNGTSWVYESTIKSTTKHTEFRWTNREEWITALEETKKDSWLINLNTNERIRLTFTNDSRVPGLFFLDGNSAVKSNSSMKNSNKIIESKSALKIKNVSNYKSVQLLTLNGKQINFKKVLKSQDLEIQKDKLEYGNYILKVCEKNGISDSYFFTVSK